MRFGFLAKAVQETRHQALVFRVLSKAEQFSLFGGSTKISEQPKNYLGTDKLGRAHWRAHPDTNAAAPATEPRSGPEEGRMVAPPPTAEIRLTFDEFMHAPREGELLEALRKLPKRTVLAAELAANAAYDAAYDDVKRANLSYLLDHPDQAENASKAKQRVWQRYQKALDAKLDVNGTQLEVQRRLYDRAVDAGLIVNPEAPTAAATALAAGIVEAYDVKRAREQQDRHDRTNAVVAAAAPEPDSATPADVPLEVSLTLNGWREIAREVARLRTTLGQRYVDEYLEQPAMVARVKDLRKRVYRMRESLSSMGETERTWLAAQLDSLPSIVAATEPPPRIRSAPGLQTLSGRTIPSPIQTRSVRNNIRTVDKWLVENAVLEAAAKGDEWNGDQFKRIDPKKITPAERTDLNVYLFGKEEVAL